MFFKYDATDKHYTGIAEIEVANSTPINPGSLVNPVFDVANNRWTGEDFNNWQAQQYQKSLDNQAGNSQKPTAQQQLNATLMAEIAANKAQQDKFNAQTLLQIAALATKPVAEPSSTASTTTDTSKEAQA